jgi:hypothetical protein
MIENILALNRSSIISDNKIRTNFIVKKTDPERIINNPVIEKLIAEGGEMFFHYLSWLGLVNEPDIMVISSRHHYYDHNDFKSLTTLINQKKLNVIKHLDSFLNVISSVLSPNTNFIGCFTDRRVPKKIELPYSMYKRRISFSESGSYIEIDKIDVFGLLESHGFEVMDMTEINRLTYFSARKIIIR